jgi:hypothetical protein
MGGSGQIAGEEEDEEEEEEGKERGGQQVVEGASSPVFPMWMAEGE